jgi:hypothetical protein
MLEVLVMGLLILALVLSSWRGGRRRGRELRREEKILSSWPRGTGSVQAAWRNVCACEPRTSKRVVDKTESHWHRHVCNIRELLILPLAACLFIEILRLAFKYFIISGLFRCESAKAGQLTDKGRAPILID